MPLFTVLGYCANATVPLHVRNNPDGCLLAASVCRARAYCRMQAAYLYHYTLPSSPNHDTMANRLSVIATRTGDDGTTGLGDGSRIPKDALRIAALGDVDELNSVLGLLLTEPLHPDVTADLMAIQNDLFDMGAELCIPGHTAVTEDHIASLDARLVHYNATLPPLREFILPGGTRGAAHAHVARTVCRRAERAVVALARSENVNPPVRQYLNRLSDLLFVLARCINQQMGQKDSFWTGAQARK